MLSDLTVVVPVRNAEAILEDCLASVVASEPAALVVIDGLSTDGTRGIAERFGATILSDEGRGLPAARLLGAQAAATKFVALVDADVVLPEGALAALVDELVDDGYTALQAGLESECVTEDYWGEALAYHHRTGRSRAWFGLVATVFERDVLLEHGFDDTFVSGEDIELRWRLAQAGHKIGVSARTVARHRFEPGWKFARGQWDADGKGLARMVRKHGLRGAPLLGMPLAGAARGIGLAILRGQPKWIPYYLCYLVFNYVAMASELR